MTDRSGPDSEKIGVVDLTDVSVASVLSLEPEVAAKAEKTLAALRGQGGTSPSGYNGAGKDDSPDDSTDDSPDDNSQVR